jgi:hypothetical protein
MSVQVTNIFEVFNKFNFSDTEEHQMSSFLGSYLRSLLY